MRVGERGQLVAVAALEWADGSGHGRSSSKRIACSAAASAVQTKPTPTPWVGVELGARAPPGVPSGVSARSGLRWLLPRAWSAQPEPHALFATARLDDERETTHRLNPKPARVGEPARASVRRPRASADNHRPVWLRRSVRQPIQSRSLRGTNSENLASALISSPLFANRRGSGGTLRAYARFGALATAGLWAGPPRSARRCSHAAAGWCR